MASDARARYLDQACSNDRQLRNDVDELLKHFEDDSGQLSENAILNVSRLVADDAPGEHPRNDQIGPYRITQRLGEGGFGTVYLATRSGEFRQRVAIKILRDNWRDSEQVTQRFGIERQILSDLNHENISRILDGGSTEQGRPYFVMEYVDGIPITSFCEKNQLNVAQRLELFMRVCQAVAHAHQFGIIHRDIKPTNILVTHDGTPKLIDFGIAKLIDTPAESRVLDLTQTGLLPFTPEYASPEQVRGEPVGQTSDIYSLGVVLYELLAGRRPYSFRTRSASEIERIVCHDVPAIPSTVVGTNAASTKKHEKRTFNADCQSNRPVRSIDSRRRGRLLDGDLDTITLMALRKEPARRYQTAQQLCDDIANHIASRPVSARRDSVGYVIGKYLKRNRMPVLAATMASIALVGFLVAAYSSHRRSVQVSENRKNTYSSDMNVAYQSWEWGNLDRVQTLLAKHVPQSNDSDLRQFEWYYLAHLCEENVANSLISGVDLISLRPGSDMLVAVRSNHLTLVDFANPREPRLTDLPTPTVPGKVKDVAFTPDGNQLAIGYELNSETGLVCVLDLTTDGIETFTCDSPIRHLCFSPDGVHGACAGPDGFVAMWKTNALGIIWTHHGHNGKRCERVAFSPDGRFLATVSKYDRSVAIWNARDGELEKTVSDLGGIMFGVTFSPQGDLLVIGTRLHLLDKKDWICRPHPLSAPNLNAVFAAFSPDGHKLAIATGRGVVEVRDFITGELLGRRLYSVADRYSVRRVGFTDDGQRIVSGSADSVSVWDLATASLSSVHGWNDCPAIGTASNTIAMATRENCVVLWDPKADTLKTVGKHDESVTALACSVDGRLLAAASGSFIRVWDTSDGGLENEFQSEETVAALAVSPDERYLISGEMRNGEKLWNLSTGEQVCFGSGTSIVSAFFTADGRLVTAGGNGDRGDLRIWDCQATKPQLISELHGPNHVTSAVASPGGQFVATGDTGGDILVYDLRNLHQKAHLIAHGGAVTTLAFSPNGETLISGGADGMLGFWDVQNWRQMGTIRHQRHVEAVRLLEISPEQQGLLIFHGEPEYNVSLNWIEMRRRHRLSESFERRQI